MKWLPVLLLLSTVAYAQPSTVSPAQNLLSAARNAARDGRCDAIPTIAARAKAMDPAFYEQQFAVDAEIVSCTPHAPRPATVTLGVDAPMPAGYVPPASGPFAPPGMTEPVGIVEDTPSGDYKSPNMALGLSLGTTAAGFGLMIAAGEAHNDALGTIGAIAFLAGPTTGQAYAHHTSNGGLWMRVGGAASLMVGASMAIGCWDSSNCNDGLIVTLVYGGLALFGVGTIYEIATAPAAAREYNRTHHLLPASMAVAPIATRDSAGIALTGRF